MVVDAERANRLPDGLRESLVRTRISTVATYDVRGEMADEEVDVELAALRDVDVDVNVAEAYADALDEATRTYGDAA